MSKSKESQATGLERTGANTFNVKHDDGSIFECNVQNSKQLDSIRGMKGRGVAILSYGIGEKKPLVCDICNKRVYKITCKDGKSFCMSCLAES